MHRVRKASVDRANRCLCEGLVSCGTADWLVRLAPTPRTNSSTARPDNALIYHANELHNWRDRGPRKLVSAPMQNTAWRLGYRRRFAGISHVTMSRCRLHRWRGYQPDNSGIAGDGNTQVHRHAVCPYLPCDASIFSCVNLAIAEVEGETEQCLLHVMHCFPSWVQVSPTSPLMAIGEW